VTSKAARKLGRRVSNKSGNLAVYRGTCFRAWGGSDLSSLLPVQLCSTYPKVNPFKRYVRVVVESIIPLRLESSIADTARALAHLEVSSKQRD
jgi:hypothetical protein